MGRPSARHESQRAQRARRQRELVQAIEAPVDSATRMAVVQQYLVQRLRTHATRVGIARLETVRAALGGEALEVAPASAIRLKAHVTAAKTGERLLDDGDATGGACTKDKADEQAAQRLRATVVTLTAAAQRKGRRSSLFRRTSITDGGSASGGPHGEGPDRLAGPVPRLDCNRDIRLALRLRKPDCELGEQTAVTLRSFQPALLSLVSGSTGEDLLMLVRAAFSRGQQSNAGVV